MPSIRKAKKLGIYKKPTYNKKIYAETRESVELVNKRLKALKNANLEGTWASRKLKERLSTKKLKAYTKTGKVKISKRLNNTQLIAIQKANKQFLESKTSTIKGIKDTKEATIKSLEKTLSKDLDMSNLDGESAYEMLGNKDFDYFNTEDRIPASEMWALIDDAIEGNQNEKTFISRLLNIMDFSNDQDAIDRAKRIYQNYVL